MAKEVGVEPTEHTCVHSTGFEVPICQQHTLEDPLFGTGDRFPRWVKQSGLPHLPAKGILESVLLQIEAARNGMGIGFLPCFVGDRDPQLIRVDDKANFPKYELWLLRHPDTRQTARLRVFADFMAESIAEFAPLLEGE